MRGTRAPIPPFMPFVATPEAPEAPPVVIWSTEKLKPLPVAEVINAVAREFQVKAGDLRGRSRTKNLILARGVIAKLLRDRKFDNGKPRYTFTQIGRILGGRDHSTIVHAASTFDVRVRHNPEMRDAYERLRGAA